MRRRAEKIGSKRSTLDVKTSTLLEPNDIDAEDPTNQSPEIITNQAYDAIVISSRKKNIFCPRHAFRPPKSYNSHDNDRMNFDGQLKQLISTQKTRDFRNMQDCALTNGTKWLVGWSSNRHINEGTVSLYVYCKLTWERKKAIYTIVIVSNKHNREVEKQLLTLYLVIIIVTNSS